MGESIRAVLLDSRTSGLSPWTELALMFASRTQHIDEVILPALKAGKFVLCDRFTDSSEAYQGGGRRLGSAPVLELHKVLCRGLQPDLTILMRSDVAASVARARRRNVARVPSVADAGVAAGDENRFEKESRAFFERVMNTYEEIAQREPERVFAIDARPAPEVVHQQIVRAVRERVLEKQFRVSSC